MLGQSKGAGRLKKPPTLPKLSPAGKHRRGTRTTTVPPQRSPPQRRFSPVPPVPEPSLAAGSSPGPPSAGLAALPPPSPARTGPPRSSSVHLKWLLPKGGEVVPGPRPVTHRGAGLGSARLSSARLGTPRAAAASRPGSARRWRRRPRVSVPAVPRRAGAALVPCWAPTCVLAPGQSPFWHLSSPVPVPKAVSLPHVLPQPPS